jgi:hypothetical protein
MTVMKPMQYIDLSRLLTSSLWFKPHHVLITWLTLALTMDKTGFTQLAAPQVIADRANLPLDQTVEALKILEAPDPDCEFISHEGRRIQRMNGGYQVLDHDMWH